MKKTFKNIIKSSALVLSVAACASIAATLSNKSFIRAEAYPTSSLPSTIDLNDTPEETIRNYYSSLETLNDDERKGTNLLKNLKTILMKDQKYYSYDTDSNGRKIWQIYEIADRDWEKSPASELSGYDESTNTIKGYKYGTSASDKQTNPFIHALYVNREVDNKVRAWAVDGGSKTSHGDNAEWCIDREHIWPKSQGFEAEGAGGARGDLMHLWPGDSDVNSSVHNNQLYGFVNITSSTKKGKWSYATNNYVGTSLTIGSGENVFEPQDSDKGDIARAIFYMVARYNNLAGNDTNINADNPNLELAQTNAVLSAYTSTATNPGKMGILTDLLEWHHLDPVDEFEIHRNNLLFTNYTNNRNPFIDFPDWVDYIWGTAVYEDRVYKSYDNTPTGLATPSTDKIGVGEVCTKLEITSPATKTQYKAGDKLDKTGLVVTATFEDETTRNVTKSCNYKYDFSEAGEKTVTISFRGKSVSYNVTVAKKGIDWKMIAIIAAIVVVVILVIVGISIGVLKVNKKGKIKVNKSGVKKLANGSSKTKNSSKKKK